MSFTGATIESPTLSILRIGRGEISVAEQPSLYDNAVQSSGQDPNTRPDPGTIITASYETIDNDRAALMLDAGVVR